jgi:hypothetical protein
MTSRELTGQDFSIDMSAVANLSDKSEESVFKMLWEAWKNAEDLDIRLSVKKSTYSSANNTDVDDLINATMKIETFNGDFEDGLAGLEISLVVNGFVELAV